MIAARHIVALVLSLLAGIGNVAAVELRPFEAGSLAAILAAKPGRPLVVSFWSTTCAPCRKELGELGAWKKRHPAVDVVLINVDAPDERDAAARVLEGYKLAGVETWSFADDYAERLRWSVDPQWRGEVPRTHLYDAAHRLTVHTGSLAPRQLDRWAAGAARDARKQH